MALLGDAARTTGFKTFTANRDDAGGNTPALATLAGARLVSAGEPDEGVRFSESVIKSLTGEDEIQVCQKYERPFTFLPRFKIWLHVNHKPGIRGTDEGIWRRPRLIPFTVSFMGAEEAKAKNVTGVRRDPDLVLDDKLDAERVGILAWAVRGARTWYRIGLRSCKSVDDATSDYRGESDRLKPFIDECVKDDPGKFVTNDRLCEAYSSWCKRNLIQHEMNGQTLSKQMAAKGYLRGKDGKDQRGFKDISLVTPGGLMGMN
jgi:putative DNA primase/helicase